jgi:PhnB protein
MITLNPYLNFMGQTEAAMEFYKSIFGGELTMQTFKEAGFPHEPKDDNLVIHAMLKNDMFIIMASDGNAEHPVKNVGDNIHLSLQGSDQAKLTEFFNKLASGGKVDMKLEKQFWGDTYGQVTDKFGIHWAVNITSGEQNK